MSIADEQRVSASGATTAQSASQPDAYSPQVIRKLNALTSDFYAREAASFSATRQAPWHGWEKAWELITAPDAAQGPFPSHAAVRDSLSSRAARIPDDYASNSKDSLAVLDLGCGNLRFERFLAERTNAPLRVTALDNCPDLASPEIGALSAAFPHSLRSSSAASKTKEEDASGQGANPPEKTVVSFWQFLNDPRLAAKAATVTAEGRAAHCLPTFQENDFLLGWQHAEGTYRFCHHTPEDEIDALLAAIREPSAPSTSGCAPPAPLPFREIARFSADGKLGNLNRYLILQRL